MNLIPDGMNLIPTTREEMFLDAIQKELNGESANPGITPVTREEMFLAAIFSKIQEFPNSAQLEKFYEPLNEAARDAYIHWFAKFLDKYNLSLTEFGKIRAAIYYYWSNNPNLTVEEISEIFGEADPGELDAAALETATLKYAKLSWKDWAAISDEDARCNISSTYLRSRAEIQAWISTHYRSDDGGS